MSMENLSISDAPPHQQQQPGGGGMPPMPMPMGLGRASIPPPTPQLPPQMFTTAAQLLDLTDKKLLVSLRDGRRLIGVLRSWDQFANLVLQSTVERISVPPSPPPRSPTATSPSTPSQQKQQRRGLYADIPRGLFLVRGENVLLLGEIDLDKDDDPPPGYDLADAETVEKLLEERKERDRARERKKLKLLNAQGFEGENLGEVLL